MLRNMIDVASDVKLLDCNSSKHSHDLLEKLNILLDALELTS